MISHTGPECQAQVADEYCMSCLNFCLIRRLIDSGSAFTVITEETEATRGTQKCMQIHANPVNVSRARVRWNREGDLERCIEHRLSRSFPALRER